MIGAIKAQFVDVTEMDYNIDGRDINTKYIIIIDDDAQTINNRYVNLKIDQESWEKLQLNNISKVKELQGKLCEFHGSWVKRSQSVRLQDGSRVGIPQWGFQIKLIKEIASEKKV